MNTIKKVEVRTGEDPLGSYGKVTSQLAAPSAEYSSPLDT